MHYYNSCIQKKLTQCGWIRIGKAIIWVGTVSNIHGPETFIGDESQMVYEKIQYIKPAQIVIGYNTRGLIEGNTQINNEVRTRDLLQQPLENTLFPVSSHLNECVMFNKYPGVDAVVERFIPILGRRRYTINLDDFLEVLNKVQPSSKREGFATIPNYYQLRIVRKTLINSP
ncbi:hypothetical protein CONCODRAFT_7335 [Conidiobolus coronatus NRRL 28638]|uniref:Uncharacterized protein n=1 Tax=Conidiobolus coronatus (strain ATCC 28846 / CBS 209.66 / NRRL 28638) TaxID=796925 RepID=A0A137P573_CONC2|nr:hypothetical protein CONCODRAFT_7335 [Conidiobolus coronatus NRRL 28638]|eukprot:KXN70099.1 hypothetical protein CONCODRAFT_7335 [Conidiobolus coronatus NRRL 28638]